MLRLLPERPEDAYEVELLFDLAFAPGRESLSSYRLREGVAPVGALARVARDEYDAVAGAVRFWPVLAGGGPALLLGPIAVHPTRQGEGVGALLMSAGLEAAEASGWRRIVLVGDLPYYRRFGFARVPLAFPPPVNPDRVLGLDLDGNLGEAGDWSGAVTRWPAEAEEGRPGRIAG